MGMESKVGSLVAPKQQLEQLKAQKGRLSRLIGDAKKTGANADALIAELKGVSAQIKSLQKQVKQQLAAASVESRWMPPTISAPGAILDGSSAVPAEGVSVGILEDMASEEVDAYVVRHPGASVWHQPVVASFIAQTYGHKTRYLCARDANNSVVGVLPVAELNSRLFGHFMVSLPYFNYGGVLANTKSIARKLIEAGTALRRDTGARHLEMRTWSDMGLGLPQRTDKVTFWLPLPDNQQALWDSFKPKLRAQVRHGERETSEIIIGGHELLDEFYRVFSINMRDLGTPVYGKNFFRDLLTSLAGNAWLVVARIDGKASGCAFITGYRERMEIPWASTLRKYNHTAINMAMYWAILKFAIDQRYRVFDFGRCSEGAGTYRFKQQWGAQPLRLYWDYVLPEGQALPALNPDNPKFRLLIAIWRRLPVFIANLIGPSVVKDLP